VNSAAAEMKLAGMLNPATDVSELAKRAFVHLEGVSDEWLQTVKVEKLAGGQVSPDQNLRVAAAFAPIQDTLRVASCCSPETK
jgi:hypothetical protein